MSRLFVIARNSSFTYKGKAVKVQQVATELGGRYVLEGSVPATGDDLRMTAQLINAVGGHHIWIQRDDRPLAEFFAVQDDITLSIARALHTELVAGIRPGPFCADQLKAWEHLLRAGTAWRELSRSGLKETRKLSLQALEIDPGFTSAKLMLGWTHWREAHRKWNEDPERSLQLARQAAEGVLADHPDYPGGHALLGSVFLLERKHDEAIASLERARDLASSNPTRYAILAIATYYADQFRQTIALTKTPMRLHPHYPSWYDYRIGVAYMMAAEHENAIASLERWYSRMQYKPRRKVTVATAYAMAGQRTKARALVAEALADDPKITVKSSVRLHRFRDKAQLLSRPPNASRRQPKA